MKKEITAQELYNYLCDLDLSNNIGSIYFNLAGLSVKITTTDTVGITLQAWLKAFLEKENLYYEEPKNTQEFPDFFLNKKTFEEGMLEIKAFKYSASPAFDIANFESYCSSLAEKPFRIFADYLIFGYTMSENGDVVIKKIWLHKIWEIAGISQRYPLKTQIKRDMIYNIRPNNSFKSGKGAEFKSKEEFLKAIYDTLTQYKDIEFAKEWKETLVSNYRFYYNDDLQF